MEPVMRYTQPRTNTCYWCRKKKGEKGCLRGRKKHYFGRRCHV